MANLPPASAPACVVLCARTSDAVCFRAQTQTCNGKNLAADTPLKSVGGGGGWSFVYISCGCIKLNDSRRAGCSTSGSKYYRRAAKYRWQVLRDHVPSPTSATAFSKSGRISGGCSASGVAKML